MDARARRLAALERQVRRAERLAQAYRALGERLSGVRLSVFVGAAVLVFAAFSALGTTAGTLMLAATAAVWLGLARYHGRVKERLTRCERFLALKRTHIARMRLDWAHIPFDEMLEARPEHPFEADLDLVGPRSLHHLIDTAFSQDGSRRLRDWLAETSVDLEVTRVRRGRVQALAALPLFRDRLALHVMGAAGGQRARLDGAGLLAWAAHLPERRQRGGLGLLMGLAALNIALYILHQTGALPPLWPFSFGVYAVVYNLLLRGEGDLFGRALALEAPIANLRAVFAVLETSPQVRRPPLDRLCAPFLDPAVRPSTLLRRLTRVVSAASLRRNPYLWFLVNAVMPWDYLVALSLDRQRAALAARLPLWLDAYFELEALNSLATFAYLNPDYTYAALDTAGETPVFSGRGLGHPLIPRERRVCNDFRFEALGEIVLLTGSNMSGKSSWLRTIGINLRLTFVGAPAAASACSTQALRLFTCIRVNDSVTDGFSYFYAEVLRLRALLDAFDTPGAPLCFLIDEIFKGTNNRERLIGSRGYIRALAGRRGVGIVSTHDLELTRLADELPQLRNQHFREDVEDGRMVFDYRLRPGPSPTTNALTIMRLEGLPVEDAGG